MHVTVYDQGGNPIPPADITWQASSVVNVVADTGANPTGFNISALARSTPFSFVLEATLATQNPTVSTGLTINLVLAAVTGLQFSSP